MGVRRLNDGANKPERYGPLRSRTPRIAKDVAKFNAGGEARVPLQRSLIRLPRE
jgi:hypothetical protein